MSIIGLKPTARLTQNVRRHVYFMISSIEMLMDTDRHA